MTVREIEALFLDGYSPCRAAQYFGRSRYFGLAMWLAMFRGPMRRGASHGVRSNWRTFGLLSGAVIHRPDRNVYHVVRSGNVVFRENTLERVVYTAQLNGFQYAPPERVQGVLERISNRNRRAAEVTLSMIEGDPSCARRICRAIAALRQPPIDQLVFSER